MEVETAAAAQGSTDGGAPAGSNKMDLRGFISKLEAEGLLHRVKKEVDWDLELSHVAKLNEEKKGPALLFENVKEGNGIPVLTSAYTTPSRSIAPLDFLRQMRCAGCGKLPADGFAYHPYDLTHAPSAVPANPTQVTIGTLPRLFRALDTGGVFRRGLGVYLTEWGYAQSGREAVGPATQAKYTAQAVKLLAASSRVRELVQYGLYTRPGTSFDTGIVTTAGAPLPAFKALANR